MLHINTDAGETLWALYMRMTASTGLIASGHLGVVVNGSNSINQAEYKAKHEAQKNSQIN